ncbi:MAG: beta-lactamase family protein [Verrucomicrobia bacterium]|nr:beta-lactamase family protein [Verrucomicrobiota bacterium]
MLRTAFSLRLFCYSLIFTAINFWSSLCADFSPAVIAQLDSIFEAASAEVGGIIAGVWVGDQNTWVRTKGTANIPANRPLLYADMLRIGSVTKSFTTTVLLQLVEEGLIGLDESIERFNLGVPNANNITIRMLCNHTSGLYNYTEDPDFNQIIITTPWKEWSQDELVQVATSHPPLFPPGTQVKYNNTNFILQGMIIEQLMGIPVGRAIEARVILPLRLENTFLPRNPYLYGEFSRGYFFSPPEIFDFTVLNPSGVLGAGGLVSNLRDLKTWAKALGLGSLLSPSMQQQRLIRVAPPADPGPFQGPFLRFGLGIEMLGNFLLDNNNVFLGHEGDIICYNASMNYLISQDATFVVLINKNPTDQFPSDNATKLFMALAKVLFPANCPWP